MEKRIEKWESLRLEAQEFTPQEFVAQCELIINTEYLIDPSTIQSSSHILYDCAPYGVFSASDVDGRGQMNSDGSTSSTSLFYIGRGWGIRGQSGALKDLPDVSNNKSYTEAEMVGMGYELFYLLAPHTVSVPPGAHDVHVYGGSERTIISRNVSG